MAPICAPRPLSELVAHVGGVLSTGDGRQLIHGVGGLSEAGPEELSFFGNLRYAKQLKDSQAGAVLVPPGPLPDKPGTAFIQVDVPHLAFARISELFHCPERRLPGVHPQAWVHPLASVHPSAAVMAFVTVEGGAKVGARTVLYPGVYLGADAEVGEDSVLYPNVTVRERCQVGARVIVHASAVVGADGFGFAFDPAGPAHVKIPQAGIVRIEDDVELGAGTCVDRATTGETVVGRGSKVDNLVQIAHNVRVGPLSLLCAQAGVSGSAELGTGVVLAGQVGVVGHIRVGDLAKVGAQSGVAHDVEDGATVSGSPAMDHREWLRASAAFKQVRGLLKEVRALRLEVEALKKAKEQG